MLRSLGRADVSSLVFKKRTKFFVYTVTFCELFSLLQWYPSSYVVLMRVSSRPTQSTLVRLTLKLSVTALYLLMQILLYLSFQNPRP